VAVVEQWCISMKQAGIKRVLTLLNESELSFYNENLLETYNRFFTEVHTLPQNSSATLTTVLEAFKSAEFTNEPIVVHCSTGQGRTGTILALWLHHRYGLPIPAAVTECMEHASKEGGIRKPSIEALMQLLLGSAQRILPHIRNLQPERENGSMRGATPRIGVGSTNATPSATPRLDSKLHITFVQTGGTIDKDYPRSKGGYAFEITDPAVDRILANVDKSFSFDVVTACKKDSTEMTNDDRDTIIDLIEKSDSMRFIITHGSDTLIETAKYLDRAGLSVGKVVVLCAAMRPEHFRNSDAHFNVGVAMGAVNVLWSGVYVAMCGRVVEASRATRDNRTGLFNVK
jgi:L-asparaginase